MGNFVWAKGIGGIYDDQGFSITADTAGNVYSTGYFKGTVNFNPGAGTNNLTTTSDDVFILKLNSSGNFLWAKQMGGSQGDYSVCITLDASGNIYTTGIFSGTGDFDPGVGICNLSCPGAYDVFISSLDISGNFRWAVSVDGTGVAGTSIATDAGNVYTTGYFKFTADFEPGSGVTILTSARGYEIFVLKLSQSPTGLIETNFSGEFNLFPNPTNGDFTIDAGKQYNAVTITVMNVTGQEVFNAAYQSTNTFNVRLDAPLGIYVVEMRSSEGSIGRVKVVVD